MTAAKVILALIRRKLDARFRPQQVMCEHCVKRNTGDPESELLKDPLIKSNVLTYDTAPVKYILKESDHDDPLRDGQVPSGEGNGKYVLTVAYPSNPNAPQVVVSRRTLDINNNLIIAP